MLLSTSGFRHSFAWFIGYFMGLAKTSLRWQPLNTRIMAAMITWVYQWYTRRLLKGVKARPMPHHVAMILDGNRRFARQHGLKDVMEGHRYGAQKVSEVVAWCDELKIPTVTLWGLSTDNLTRTPEEMERISQIMGERLETFCDDPSRITTHRRIKAVGRLELLPESLCRQIADAERLTASSGPWLLNVAVAYGGRDEIIDAIKNMLRARAAEGQSMLEVAEQLTMGDLQQHLYAPDVPSPDLIIRTSGELRLSGFLLWQSVHSELYFCDAYWPVFRKIDFLRAIRSFQDRQRRFGR